MNTSEKLSIFNNLFNIGNEEQREVLGKHISQASKGWKVSEDWESDIFDKLKLDKEDCICRYLKPHQVTGFNGYSYKHCKQLVEHLKLELNRGVTPDNLLKINAACIISQNGTEIVIAQKQKDQRPLTDPALVLMFLLNEVNLNVENSKIIVPLDGLYLRGTCGFVHVNTIDPMLALWVENSQFSNTTIERYKTVVLAKDTKTERNCRFDGTSHLRNSKLAYANFKNVSINKSEIENGKIENSRVECSGINNTHLNECNVLDSRIYSGLQSSFTSCLLKHSRLNGGSYNLKDTVVSNRSYNLPIDKKITITSIQSILQVSIPSTDLLLNVLYVNKGVHCSLQDTGKEISNDEVYDLLASGKAGESVNALIFSMTPKMVFEEIADDKNLQLTKALNDIKTLI